MCRPASVALEQGRGTQPPTARARAPAQSGALLRYAGRKSGLYPSDAYDALRVDEVVCVIDDVAASAPQDPDAAIKKAKREAWVTEKLPKVRARRDRGAVPPSRVASSKAR